MKDFHVVILIVFAGFIAGSIVYNAFFSRKAIIKRRLKKTGVTDISSAQTGDVVHIRGEVIKAGKELHAPLSGRRCSYYHILIRERRSTGKSSTMVTIIDEEVAGTVVIKQGTHYALIKTESVKSHLIQDRQYQSGFLNDATPRLEAVLNEFGKKSTGLFGLNKTIEYKEGVIEAGEIIAVHGKAEWKPTNDLKLKLPAARVLVIEADYNESVYISDDPDITESE